MEEKKLAQVAFEAYWVTGNPTTVARWETMHHHDKAAWEAGVAEAIAAHEARRWRSIESAPKDHYILAWSPERRMSFQVIWCDSLDDWQLLGADGIATMEFTLWTPIPAPPKEASDAE